MEITKKFKTFQGDVDIFSIGNIPKSAKPLDTKTVMYGEKTGHHHTFQGQVIIYEPTENDTVNRRGEKVLVQKYVQLSEPQVIQHQEHASQTIPKGNYAILQEREWDVVGNQLRKVID